MPPVARQENYNELSVLSVFGRIRKPSLLSRSS
jgi:hypothetical protein